MDYNSSPALSHEPNKPVKEINAKVVHVKVFIDTNYHILFLIIDIIIFTKTQSLPHSLLLSEWQELNLQA